MSGTADQQSEIEALNAAAAHARKRADAGDLTGARTLLEAALATAELRLGRDHLKLAPLMVDLATIAREVGNLTEAQTQLRRAYEIVVASAGPEHASALKIEARLAVVTHRLGEPTDAFDWHLADAGARILGADHPAVRGARERLAARQGMGSGVGVSEVSPPPPPVPEPPPRYELPRRDVRDQPASWPPPVSARIIEQSQAPPPSVWAPPTYIPSAVYAGVYDRRPDEIQVLRPLEPDGQDIEIWQEPGAPPAATRERPRSAAGLAVVALLCAAVLLAGAVIGVKALSSGFRPGPEGGPPLNLPTASDLPTTAPPTTSPTTPAANPPTDVKLADAGGSVTLTWRDPTAGTVPFLVTGGRADGPVNPLESVPAGRTRSIVYGLNNKVDYCFTVTAVYSASVIASSTRICTHRLPTGNAT